MAHIFEYFGPQWGCMGKVRRCGCVLGEMSPWAGL